ncbi:MAG: hydrogenase, partial [Acidobacteria bacterium]
MTPNWLSVPLALLLAPLLPGVINRTKAFFAGRNGQPLLQAYFDVVKLFRKGAVYSRTTTWVFRAGPIVTTAALLTLVPLSPFGGQEAPLSFTGDIIVFCALLGLARFFTVIAALDTGSAFEGMGASREVLFGALAEPALYLALAALVRHTHTWG